MIKYDIDSNKINLHISIKKITNSKPKVVIQFATSYDIKVVSFNSLYQ